MSKRPQAETDAIGYVRVSTAGQAADGVSLDAQEAKIREHCRYHALKLHEIYRDEGLSGKAAEKRPGLQAAIKNACETKGTLVAYSLSRLGRSTLDCINISQQLEKCGAQFASITEQIDTTTPMGRCFFTIMAALGELEREQLSARTKTALQHKKAQGQRVSRFAPFGYQFADDGKTLVKNRRESAAIKRMLSQRAQGWTLRQIAEDLSKRGIEPRSKAWYASTIRNVLNREYEATG